MKEEEEKKVIEIGKGKRNNILFYSKYSKGSTKDCALEVVKK